MKIKRFFSEELVETADNVDAFVLLFANEKGEMFYAMDGDEAKLKEIFIHGVLYWPIYSGFALADEVILEMLLKENPLLPSTAKRVSPKLLEARLLHAVFQEKKVPYAIGTGNESVCISDARGYWHGGITYAGIETSLLFVMQGERKLIARRGFSVQKKLLVLYAIKALFGPRVHEQTEDILLGEFKTQWYQFARARHDNPNARIVMNHGINDN